MPSSQSPFQMGWGCINLPQYREYPEPLQGTYNFWPCENLPPWTDFLTWMPDLGKGTFHWLRQWGWAQDPDLVSDGEEEVGDDCQVGVELLRQEAERASLSLPSAFQTFLSSPEPSSRVRSCTDCYLDFPPRVTLVPFDEILSGDTGFLLRFLSDSQSCLHWYLYLTPRRKHSVVVSPRLVARSIRATEIADFKEHYGEEDRDYLNLLNEGEEEPQPQLADFWRCAESFEEFLFRFWMENEIWYALQWDKVPLSEPQRHYAEQCQQLGQEFAREIAFQSGTQPDR